MIGIGNGIRPELDVGPTWAPNAIWTDHNPLVFLTQMHNKSRHLMNWSLRLQTCIVEIWHTVMPDWTMSLSFFWCFFGVYFSSYLSHCPVTWKGGGGEILRAGTAPFHPAGSSHRFTAELSPAVVFLASPWLLV